jgi:hypothetical protein
MICLPLPISEYLIYKFPEESHLSAEEVAQKRHKELLKRNQTYAFFHKWAEDLLKYKDNK